MYFCDCYHSAIARWLQFHLLIIHVILHSRNTLVYAWKRSISISHLILHFRLPKRVIGCHNVVGRSLNRYFDFHAKLIVIETWKYHAISYYARHVWYFNVILTWKIITYVRAHVTLISFAIDKSLLNIGTIWSLKYFFSQVDTTSLNKFETVIPANTTFDDAAPANDRCRISRNKSGDLEGSRDTLGVSFSIVFTLIFLIFFDIPDVLSIKSSTPKVYMCTYKK